jgi:hypothetical protein
MGYNPYHFILFPGSKTFTQEQLRQALAGPYVEIVTVDERTLRVVDLEDQVEAQVVYCDEPYVLEEAREIAEHFQGDEQARAYLRSCDRRVEVIADPDDDMLYFNNWLIATERLQALIGGMVVDEDGMVVDDFDTSKRIT